MRVLVVDDDPVSLELVRHTVEKLGHEVVTATDGGDARRKFLSDWFPAVITDWEMPDLSGIELCRQIRNAELPTYTYILVLTSRREKRHLMEALEAGADDFISKPFTSQEVQVRLRAAERIGRLERDLRDVNTELRIMNQRLMKTCRVDPLMEIGNRLDFEERMSAFHRHAVTTRSSYGVIMCDVDHFKRHNDKLGHQNGDQILRNVAATIRQTLRANDAAFRYGGEEVLLFLNQQDIHGSVVAAERVRQRLEQQEFLTPNSGEAIHLTISCGVTSYPLDPQGGDDWQKIVELADRALYEAKSAGRNCVMAAYRDCFGQVSFKPAESLQRADGTSPQPARDAAAVPTDPR